MLTPTERAYLTLCWTVWQAGIDLWMERWIGAHQCPPSTPTP